MDPTAVEMMTNMLRARIDLPDLKLSMEQLNPVPPEAPNQSARMRRKVR